MPDTPKFGIDFAYKYVMSDIMLDTPKLGIDFVMKICHEQIMPNNGYNLLDF